MNERMGNHRMKKSYTVLNVLETYAGRAVVQFCLEKKLVFRTFVQFSNCWWDQIELSFETMRKEKKK